ncbi:sugar ABC transporter substrate-binding protein [Streptomyces werraensis]|uniref:sugar ABC transporter substrate-binding protein n=1 Tax=Streptomyces werraensis TaxID=68284 RepID=UPI001CE2A9DE
MNGHNIRTALVRRAPATLVISALATTLAACSFFNGKETDGNAAPLKKGNDIAVGLLLPDEESSRYRKFDYPIIKRQVATLTENRGRVVYANARQDAAKQSTQLEQMIADKVDVIIVDPVDAEAIAPSIAKARKTGIPVIAYDRLAQGPVNAYVSFDSELIGEVQARTLIAALGSRAATSKVVMINGSVTDPNTALFKQGALSELKHGVVLAKTYDTEGWKPEKAKANMEKAIRALGAANIAGVYSANDGMAGAVIQAFKDAGVSKVPPVTGQDAELAAVQRIVAGEQYMTVYKPYAEEASAAAQVAVTLVQGRAIAFDALTRDRVDSPTAKGIPAHLVTVVAVTKDNIKDTVVRGGLYSIKDICTATYESDCSAIGMK